MDEERKTIPKATDDPQLIAAVLGKVHPEEELQNNPLKATDADQLSDAASEKPVRTRPPLKTAQLGSFSQPPVSSILATALTRDGRKRFSPVFERETVNEAGQSVILSLRPSPGPGYKTAPERTQAFSRVKHNEHAEYALIGPDGEEIPDNKPVGTRITPVERAAQRSAAARNLPGRQTQNTNGRQTVDQTKDTLEERRQERRSSELGIKAPASKQGVSGKPGKPVQTDVVRGMNTERTPTLEAAAGKLLPELRTTQAERQEASDSTLKALNVSPNQDAQEFVAGELQLGSFDLSHGSVPAPRGLDTELTRDGSKRYSPTSEREEMTESGKSVILSLRPAPGPGYTTAPERTQAFGKIKHNESTEYAAAEAPETELQKRKREQEALRKGGEAARKPLTGDKPTKKQADEAAALDKKRNNPQDDNARIHKINTASTAPMQTARKKDKPVDSLEGLTGMLLPFVRTTQAERQEASDSALKALNVSPNQDAQDFAAGELQLRDPKSDMSTDDRDKLQTQQAERLGKLQNMSPDSVEFQAATQYEAAQTIEKKQQTLANTNGQLLAAVKLQDRVQQLDNQVTSSKDRDASGNLTSNASSGAMWVDAEKQRMTALGKGDTKAAHVAGVKQTVAMQEMTTGKGAKDPATQKQLKQIQGYQQEKKKLTAEAAAATIPRGKQWMASSDRAADGSVTRNTTKELAKSGSLTEVAKEIKSYNAEAADRKSSPTIAADAAQQSKSLTRAFDQRLTTEVQQATRGTLTPDEQKSIDPDTAKRLAIVGSDKSDRDLQQFALKDAKKRAGDISLSDNERKSATVEAKVIHGMLSGKVKIGEDTTKAARISASAGKDDKADSYTQQSMRQAGEERQQIQKGWADERKQASSEYEEGKKEAGLPGVPQQQMSRKESRSSGMALGSPSFVNGKVANSMSSPEGMPGTTPGSSRNDQEILAILRNIQASLAKREQQKTSLSAYDIDRGRE